MTAIADILVAAINHPERPAEEPDAAALAAIERHTLAPFVFDELATSGHLANWPQQLRAVLQRAAAAHALLCEIRDGELTRVLTAIGESGVRAIAIKGAALAYTHYPKPHLRPRGDTDLAVRPSERDEVSRVLACLGYQRTAAVDGDLVTQQWQWRRDLRGGVSHIIDVHWRLFNPHAFAAVMPLEGVIEASVPIPALGPHGKAPNPADALLLACVHRIAHHAGEDDLLWLCDIHRIVASLDDSGAETFVERSRRAQVRAIAAHGICSARRRFATRVPQRIEELLAEADASDEPTAVFLATGRRQVDVLTSDVRALAGWGARGRLVAQHLFPPAAYMRRKYGLRTPVLLPLAYAHRIAVGVPRWMRRRSADRRS